MTTLEALQTKFATAGQEHVFEALPKLDEQQTAELVKNLEAIDFAVLKEMKEVIDSAEKTETATQSKIAPFANMVETEKTKESEKNKWRQTGLGLVSQGKIAALLMAGGQGTRLGSDAPKGEYNIGLPSGKSLFQLQAERLISLKKLAAKNAQVDVTTFALPWYIMTSPATNDPTIAFFETHDYFGFPKNDVFFFEQATLPCLSKNGKILMETFTSVSRSPNGNGGIYSALDVSGALADMKKRSIAEVFVYSVDNALVQVCDPIFMGYCFIKNIEFGNKVLEKIDATESVGVLAIKDEKNAVIEYSELSTELAEQRTEDGRLAFCCANIAIHCITVSFLEHAIASNIPYHIAHKKIGVVDSETGATVKPDTNNGVKLEKFIFDALALAKSSCAFLVPRTGNFTAVKNAPGKGLPDSPDTACTDVSEYHISLIEAAGGCVVRAGKNDWCEISPLVSYAGENLEDRVKEKELKLPLHVE